MSQIKRFFGPAYFVVNTILAARAVHHLRRPGPTRTARLGELLAHGAPVAILLRIFTLRQARTSASLPGYQAAAIVGAALTLTGPRAGALRAWLAAVAGTAAYAHWYSRLNPPPATVTLGALMPDVAFTDHTGATVRTTDLVDRPTAWMFLRGNWCPVCSAQVRELAERYQELEQLGVDVVLVAAQDEDQTRALAERFDVRFRYLRDPGLQASAVLGLVHVGGVPPGIPGYDPDTVFPTLIVTDARGRVVLLDQTDNYRVRPTPDTILGALRGADRS